MKSNSTPQPAREKKPYHKPEIEKVNLVLDEAVLATGCKFEGGFGPFGTDCEDAGGTPCPFDIP